MTRGRSSGCGRGPALRVRRTGGSRGTAGAGRSRSSGRRKGGTRPPPRAGAGVGRSGRPSDRSNLRNNRVGSRRTGGARARLPHRERERIRGPRSRVRASPTPIRARVQEPWDVVGLTGEVQKSRRKEANGLTRSRSSDTPSKTDLRGPFRRRSNSPRHRPVGPRRADGRVLVPAEAGGGRRRAEPMARAEKSSATWWGRLSGVLEKCRKVASEWGAEPDPVGMVETGAGGIVPAERAEAGAAGRTGGEGDSNSSVGGVGFGRRGASGCSSAP